MRTLAEAEKIKVLEAELAEAHDSNDALVEKLKSLAPHGSCACSYDKKGDVCAHHSPALADARQELVAEKQRSEELADWIETTHKSWHDCAGPDRCPVAALIARTAGGAK